MNTHTQTFDFILLSIDFNRYSIVLVYQKKKSTKKKMEIKYFWQYYCECALKQYAPCFFHPVHDIRIGTYGFSWMFFNRLLLPYHTANK